MWRNTLNAAFTVVSDAVESSAADRNPWYQQQSRHHWWSLATYATYLNEAAPVCQSKAVGKLVVSTSSQQTGLSACCASVAATRPCLSIQCPLDPRNIRITVSTLVSLVWSVQLRMC
jgi:xanthine dehydrogenase molybdopterin-binding subunit B